MTINVGRAADAPPTDQPATDQPATDQPAPDQPATDQPTADQPAADESTADDCGADDASTDDDIAGDDHDLTMSALWGKQTELAIGNFPIAKRPLDVRVAHALATIKRHAANVNLRLGVPGLDADVVARDRRCGPPHRGRRARRPLPRRRLPDRIGHLDEHERQRGHRHAGVAAARPSRPSQRPRQRLAVVERRRAGGDPPRPHRRADGTTRIRRWRRCRRPA